MPDEIPQSLNITPDPNILVVLSNTPLKPIDALCELIDNALDSFNAATIAGLRIDNRWVRIIIPTKRQIQNGEGVIKVIDNGLGLDSEGLRGALQAGFSTKKKYGSLGLFGVGFNIATSKFGQKTVVTTAKPTTSGGAPENALRVTLDLPELQRRGNFDVPLETLTRIERGTMVEVSNWWPAGTANSQFALSLAEISNARLLEQLGRRYSSALFDPEKKVHMLVNDEPVIPFEHCVWSISRSVTRRGIGSIPARIEFNHTVRTSRRCEMDGNLIPDGETVCFVCNGNKIKQVPEVVRGWVGVQRFDNKSDFGIDLIRSGRAIRVGEKEAFFTYADNLGQTEKEYPIDQLTGRIVGEVFLDHVDVDFTKQDFIRTSREWQEAINFLRGGGLQAKNRPDGQRNSTPLGQIFDGYRKTKAMGKEDMYMGTWNETKPDRISREVEAEYYKRFKKKEIGFYDDAKWWEHVENATIPPVAALQRCAKCSAENPENAIECAGCGEILRGKDCLGCGAKIVINATSCPTCGAAQDLIIARPWSCLACDYQNGSEDNTCGHCGADKGAPNPMDHDYLKSISTRSDELSIESKSYKYIDGSPTQPISIITYFTPKDHLKPFFNRPGIPTYMPAPNSCDILELFIDRQHPFFSELGCSLEFAVSTQLACFLEALGQEVRAKGQSVINISHRVLQDAFGDRLSLNKETVRREVESLFECIVDNASEQTWANEIQLEMTSDDRERLVAKLQQVGLLDKFEYLQMSGRFLRYVPNVLARNFRKYPSQWMGFIFRDDTIVFRDYAPLIAERASIQGQNSIYRALEECADFYESPMPDQLMLRRVKSSISLLTSILL